MLKFGLAAESFFGVATGLDLCVELLEGRIIWFKLKPAIDSVLGFGQFVKSKESGCGAVVGFYIGCVEAESSCTVKSGGAKVL